MDAPEAALLEARALGTDAFPDIGDYAPIGDCRTIALVAKNGSVEWLCLPHFSSPSVFAAALDRGGGRFSVRPAVPARVKRRYRPGSNVLVTTFECDSGTLELTDCIVLPRCGPDFELEPQHELLRELHCTVGEVPVEIVFAPRPDYGRCTPAFRRRGRIAWQCTRFHAGAFIRSDIELAPLDEGSLSARYTLKGGDVRHISFVYDEHEICAFPPLGAHARARLEATTAWWRKWSARCTYAGEHREQVLRSLLALKLLTCCTSGAVMAAASASLPEWIGGDRNWDYRYCWLRDSALVLDAFVSLGFEEEAQAFLGWLLHATRLTWPRLQVMYDLYGETRLKERRLEQLSGYRGSRPVRTGNAAHSQLQLDIYGELILTAQRFVEAGGELDLVERRMLAGLAGTVCKLWREPDQGIWEARREPRHHTFSKGMCCLALQGLMNINQRMPLGIDADKIRGEAQAVRNEIEAKAFNPKLNAYVGYFGGDEADASLLLLARHGYQPAAHPRMLGTYDFIAKELMRNGLVYRFSTASRYDGLGSPDNAFAACSFWAAEYLAGIGRRDEARALFQRLLTCANDLGIYAEEIDAGGHPTGNTPQGFTHVGLISAALAIDSLDSGRKS